MPECQVLIKYFQMGVIQLCVAMTVESFSCGKFNVSTHHSWLLAYRFHMLGMRLS